MVRKKVRHSDEPIIDAPTRARAERMERKLREYHRIGLLAGAMSHPDIPKLAEQHRITTHLLRRARTFARQYSRADLDELCALRRPNGLPLQWGHVNYLLVVKNRGARTKLQKRAAKEGWTAPTLNAAIPAQYRSEKPHGRRMAHPKSAAAGLRLLVAEGEVWLRRLDIVVDVARQDGHHDGEHQGAVEGAITLMKKMQTRLRGAIMDLSPKST